jgi:hypothetical protein
MVDRMGKTGLASQAAHHCNFWKDFFALVWGDTESKNFAAGFEPFIEAASCTSEHTARSEKFAHRG